VTRPFSSCICETKYQLHFLAPNQVLTVHAPPMDGYVHNHARPIHQRSKLQPVPASIDLNREHSLAVVGCRLLTSFPKIRLSLHLTTFSIRIRKESNLTYIVQCLFKVLNTAASNHICDSRSMLHSLSNDVNAQPQLLAVPANTKGGWSGDFLRGST
jgi:hypothetical protein